MFSNKRTRLTKSRRQSEQENLEAKQIKYFLRINSYPKENWFKICVVLKEETSLSLLRIITLLIASPVFVVEDSNFEHIEKIKIRLIRVECSVDVLQSVLIDMLSRKDDRAA